MTLSICPKEIKATILNYHLTQGEVTVLETLKKGREITIISLVNKEFRLLCLEFQTRIKKIHEILTRYQADPAINEQLPTGCGQLMDALWTGGDRAFSVRTFDVYTPKIEADICFIVKNFPESLQGMISINKDSIRLACYNVNIPSEMIQFLLDAQKEYVKKNIHAYSSFLQTLSHMIDHDRLSMIKKIFDQFQSESFYSIS